MKKIIFTTAVLFCATCMMSAQNKVNFGIKLDGNLTNVKLTNLEGSDAKFNPGATIGGFARINFNRHFALQPGININYTETKVKYEAEKSKFKYVGIEIPVYALGQYNAGNGKIFIGVGPHIGYGLSADAKTEKIASCAPGENKIELDHWYAGGGAIAGYEFNNGLFLQGGYQLSFDFSSRHASSGVKTQMISAGIGYKF